MKFQLQFCIFGIHEETRKIFQYDRLFSSEILYKQFCILCWPYLFPLFYFEETANLISKTIFLGGLMGGIYTFHDFKKRHIWPIYDNLKHPKYLWLPVFFILLQILSLIINIIF